MVRDPTGLSEITEVIGIHEEAALLIELLNAVPNGLVVELLLNSESSTSFRIVAANQLSPEILAMRFSWKAGISGAERQVGVVALKNAV